MATITKTIGTAGRDYSTITLWEADLDDAGIYTSGDDAVGECYNDTTFDESPTVDGGGTIGLTSRTLKPAQGERHDGTAGTGVRLYKSSGQTSMYFDQLFGSTLLNRVSGLEVDNGNRGATNIRMIKVNGPTRMDSIVDGCIVHGVVNGVAVNYGIEMQHIWYKEAVISNCIVYDISCVQGTSVAYGFYGSALGKTNFLNCTSHNIQHNWGGDYTVRGRGFTANPSNNNGVEKCYNCIATDCGVDILMVNGSVVENCLTSDSSSIENEYGNSITYANGLANKSSSDQYVSTLSGSEDFHLKTTSEARGAGQNLVSEFSSTVLGTTTFVEYDIDDAHRGSVWDIGADQTPATVTKTIGSAGRDYSTIVAWAADLDTQGVYANGDSAVGECYNDSEFGGYVAVVGGSTIGLSEIIIRAAEGERHDGTAGTGVTVTNTYLYEQLFLVNTPIPTKVEGLDIALDFPNTQGSFWTFTLDRDTAVTKCIARGRNAFSNTGYAFSYQVVNLHNCISYNCSTGAGIIDYSNATNRYIVNNTLYARYYGLNLNVSRSDPLIKIKNNIMFNYEPGREAFYYTGTPTTIAHWDSNMVNTSVMEGDNGYTNVPIEETLVSVLSGSEDLHALPSSQGVDNGVDLSGDIGISNFGAGFASEDIDGQLRTGIWDIGADELLGGHIRRLLLGIG